MKKLIAILTIAIVLVGAVFAEAEGTATKGAGTATLNVKVTILPDTPIFALRTQPNDANVQTAGQASVSQTDSAALTADAAANLASGTSVAVNFDVIQVSDAKSFEKFYFTVEATDLKAKQPEGVDNTDWAAIPADTKVFKISGGSTEGKLYPQITRSEETHLVTTGDNIGYAKLTTSGATATTAQTGSGRASIQYIGVLKADADHVYTIGSFSCTWEGNNTAIPVNYEATVKLTVASN